MIKTMINKIPKFQFSTLRTLQADKDSAVIKKSKIFKQLVTLEEEKESLEYDLDSIGEAVKAASKLSSGETPSKEENESLSDLKDNYSSFFDSEGEQEGASSLLNKVMGVKRYLAKELRTNRVSTNKLIKKQESLNAEPGDHTEESFLSSKRKADSTIETGESSSSSKRKAEYSDSEESSSSKKSRQSASEFIDDLPYNPFDDIGTD